MAGDEQQPDKDPVRDADELEASLDSRPTADPPAENVPPEGRPSSDGADTLLESLSSGLESAWDFVQENVLGPLGIPSGEPSEVPPTVVNGKPLKGPLEPPPVITGSMEGVEQADDLSVPRAPTPRERIYERESNERLERRRRLGKEPFELPNLGEGGEFGDKSPGFDLARTASDMAGSFTTHQQQLIRVLSTMQQVLIESIARLEAIEAYFDRLR